MKKCEYDIVEQSEENKQQNNLFLLDSMHDKQLWVGKPNVGVKCFDKDQIINQAQQMMQNVKNKSIQNSITENDAKTVKLKMILNDRSQFNEDNNFRKDIRKETCDEFNKQGSEQQSNQKQSTDKDSILEPQDLKRVSWDLFTMGFIFHEIIVLPLDLSFQLDNDYLTYMNYLTTTVFGIDILLNFNTAYQFKGTYIYDRRQIASNYFKLWFWIDFGSSFPFDIIIDAVSASAGPETGKDESDQGGNEALKIGMRILRILKFFRFIKVMKLLRVLKLKKLFGKLEDYVDLSSAMVSLYEVLKLTFIMLFFAHWLACIWHLIASYEEAAGIASWLTAQDIVNQSWEIRYVASVYWSTATMTTVGYGDIVPFTSIEKIFGIFVMLLACCIFAYIMNSIGGIFVTMDINEKLIGQKMAQANQFLKSNEIPKDLSARVRKYLEYKFEKESSQVDEKQALLVLSSSLRDEVLVAVNFNVINDCELLSRFSNKILGQLPFLLEEQIFGPEECIFQFGDQGRDQGGLSTDDRSVYFLNKGQVILCVPQTVTHLKVLDQAQTFGELGFFSNKPRSASVYTLDFVYIQKLKKLDFLNLLSQNEEDMETYMRDKHQIEIYDSYTPLNLHCFSCNSQQHFTLNCPSVHYAPQFDEKKQLIQQYNSKVKQFAGSFQRHKKVRYCARSNQSLTQEVANEIKFVHKKVMDGFGGEEDEKEKEKVITMDEISDVYSSQSSEESQPLQDIQKVDKENKENEYFDRCKDFKFYFPSGNSQIIIEQLNPLREYLEGKRLKDKVNEVKLEKPQPKSQRVRWPRSSSAERFIFFEQLIQKVGGGEEFLNKINKNYHQC